MKISIDKILTTRGRSIARSLHTFSHSDILHFNIAVTCITEMIGPMIRRWTHHLFSTNSYLNCLYGTLIQTHIHILIRLWSYGYKTIYFQHKMMPRFDLFGF